MDFTELIREIEETEHSRLSDYSRGRIWAAWSAKASSALMAEIESCRAKATALEAKCEDAQHVILRGVALMTPDQMGEWRGVRAWLEQTPEDYAPVTNRDAGDESGV